LKIGEAKLEGVKEVIEGVPKQKYLKLSSFQKEGSQDTITEF
jgi:hypothetical protein